MACIRLKIAASAAVTRQAPKAQPGTHAAIRDKGFWEMKDRSCVQIEPGTVQALFPECAMPFPGDPNHPNASRLS